MLKSQIRQIKSEKFSSQRHGFLVSVEGSDSGQEGKARGVCIPPGHHLHQSWHRSRLCDFVLHRSKEVKGGGRPSQVDEMWMVCEKHEQAGHKGHHEFTRVVGYAREASPRRRSTSSGLRRSKSRWAGFLRWDEPSQ